MSSVHTIWVLETEAFLHGDKDLKRAAEGAGHSIVLWNDQWWKNKETPKLEKQRVFFHGSLANADRIAKELSWTPGSFCNTSGFDCAAWYQRASTWLLHERYAFSTVEDLVESPREIAGDLATNGNVFVRPTSPLKQFSGRVCSLEGISLADLDHGFYYDDPTIAIVIAPVVEIQREWRFVVIDRHVVAGTEATGQKGSAAILETSEPWAIATEIACQFEAPEQVYVLDLCESENLIRIVEINPFSGADLIGCDASAIIRALDEL